MQEITEVIIEEIEILTRDSNKTIDFKEVIETLMTTKINRIMVDLKKEIMKMEDKIIENKEILEEVLGEIIGILGMIEAKEKVISEGITGHKEVEMATLEVEIMIIEIMEEMVEDLIEKMEAVEVVEVGKVDEVEEEVFIMGEEIIEILEITNINLKIKIKIRIRVKIRIIIKIRTKIKRSIKYYPKV